MATSNEDRLNALEDRTTRLEERQRNIAELVRRVYKRLGAGREKFQEHHAALLRLDTRQHTMELGLAKTTERAEAAYTEVGAALRKASAVEYIVNGPNGTAQLQRELTQEVRALTADVRSLVTIVDKRENQVKSAQRFIWQVVGVVVSGLILAALVLYLGLT